MMSSSSKWAWCVAPMILAAGCSDSDFAKGARQPLVAECAESPDAVPEGGWVCPENLTVECAGGDGAADVATIFVVNEAVDGGVSTCGGDLGVSDPGPFEVGEHTVVVTVPGADGGTEPLCEATLTVTDTADPVVTEHAIVLWSPNHKMYTVDPDDCVSVEDACDGDLEARFTWATSDEPVEAKGDGNHEPDIVVGCDSVEVRAERSGTGDGRVYRIGYVVEDGAGHAVEGSCTVSVPHDMSGDAAVEGEPAYQVSGPESCPPPGDDDQDDDCGPDDDGYDHDDDDDDDDEPTPPAPVPS